MTPDRTKPVPGEISIPGRVFIYLGARDPSDSDVIYYWIGQSLKKLKELKTGPSSGAIVDENYRITTPDNIVFYGFSFRGDIVGWERVIQDVITVHSLLIAKVNEKKLFVDRHSSYDIDKCNTIAMD